MLIPIGQKEVVAMRFVKNMLKTKSEDRTPKIRWSEDPLLAIVYVRFT